jgi:hypothetical protein
MRIIEETPTKLVVKKTESKSWIIFLCMGIGLAIFAFILIASVKSGAVTPRGSSRTTSGGAVFVLPLASLIFYFIDRRENRKALIIDSAQRTVTVVGSRTDTVSFDQIARFSLGKTPVTNASLIMLEMKDGQRYGTGIDAHGGRADDVETIVQKLGTRLNQPPVN